MGVIAVLAILAYNVGEYLPETGRYFMHQPAPSQLSMEQLMVRMYD